MMVNITNERIITISKLKAIGINDKQIISKVLSGSVNTIKSIYNKYIRSKVIHLKHEFKELLQYKLFRITHYTCSKCNTKHFFNTNIYDSHYKFSNKLFGNIQRQNLITETLDFILKRHYNNNKNNKEFQGLILYIDSLLYTDVLSYMNNTLRSYIKENYKTKLIKQYNIIKNEMNEKIQRNIRLVKEIIDRIDHINFMNNDITKLQRLRMKSSTDITGYNVDICNDLYDLINTNDELKEIFNKLNINQGIIENKLLYNKILLLIKEYNNNLYEMKFGITSYYNKKPYGTELIGALPVDDSGKFTLSTDNYDKLNSIILYCYSRSGNYKGIDNNTYKSGYKARINQIFKNPNLQLLDKGKNETKKNMKNYLSYRLMLNTEIQQKIENLKVKTYKHIELTEKQQLKTIHIKRCIKSYRENKEINDFIVSFDITENKAKAINKSIEINFDYNNKGIKSYKYNKYVKSLGIKHYFKNYMIFLPYYNNDKYLYCSFGHLMNPPHDPLSEIKNQTKLGNIRNENIFRYKMNTEMFDFIEYTNEIIKKGIKTLKDPKDRKYIYLLNDDTKYMIYDNTDLTNGDLMKFKREIINEYKDLFNEVFDKDALIKLNTVNCKFSKRITYRNFGKYYTKSNRILIQKTLQYNPIFALKRILFHELLHIQYKRHDNIFNELEQQYKEFDVAVKWNKFLSYFIEKYKLSGLDKNISQNYNVFKTNLKRIITYRTKPNINKDLTYIINSLMHINMIRKDLRLYFIEKMNEMKSKIILRNEYINDLNQKDLTLNVLYDSYENKRTNEAKRIKKQLSLINTRIEKNKNFINTLKRQRIEVFGFYTLIRNKSIINEIPKTIYNILISQIKHYYYKTLVRYINSQRSTTELIKLGLNNINYDLTYEFDQKIPKNNVEFNYKNKFDELLDHKKNTNVINEISKEITIPIKSLFKAYINVIKISYNPKTDNTLIENIYNITKKFQYLESNILNT